MISSPAQSVDLGLGQAVRVKVSNRTRGFGSGVTSEASSFANKSPLDILDSVQFVFVTVTMGHPILFQKG
jgi:hypothetical protein